MEILKSLKAAYLNWRQPAPTHPHANLCGQAEGLLHLMNQGFVRSACYSDTGWYCELADGFILKDNMTDDFDMDMSHSQKILATMIHHSPETTIQIAAAKVKTANMVKGVPSPYAGLWVDAVGDTVTIRQKPH